MRNLYAGQEARIRTGHGTTDWFQIGKGVHQGCILSPCLFNFHAEYIMRNAGLEETQAGDREEHTSELQSPSAVILEPRKIKPATVSTVSPSICHEVMGPHAMILVF